MNYRILLFLERFILFTLCFPSFCSAQETDYSFLQKNHFKYHRFQVFSEFGYTPNLKMSDNSKRSYSYFSFLSYTYENRLNLHTKEDRFSVSASLPVKITIDILDADYPAPTVSPGLYVDANFGKNSTYNNVSLQGWAFGLGTDFEIRPIALDGLTAGIGIAPNLRVGYSSTVDYSHNQEAYYLIKIGIPSKLEPTDPELPKWANLRAGFYFNFPISTR
jgi:hypothetical protein